MPSGASTGIYEALELRDGDKSRYLGKGEEGTTLEPVRGGFRTWNPPSPQYLLGEKAWNPKFLRSWGPREET